MPRAKYGFLGFWDLANHDTEFRIVVLVATSLWLYSTILKLPFVQPSNYSDVGWLWIRDVYQGHHNLQIPYLQYELEYPQIIGAIILLGQAISTYLPFVADQYNTFVAIESILLYPFMLGTLFNLYMLCGKLRLSRKRIYLYMLTTLTFVIYGFYNWDFMVAYLVTLSIWLYLDGRFDASSLTLTAAVLTKFIPGLMLPAMLAGLPNNRARLRFTSIAAAVWIAANAPFALLNFDLWIKLFIGYSGPNHQLQNTWIGWVITTAGLGDIVSGARYGQILSFAIIIYLIIRAVLSERTALEKILLSWYAWYGAIYLFDPQMFIQLFPIVILTPDFNFLFYRIADVLNAFIILFYFIGAGHPSWPRYLTDQLTPFGLINTSAALRQLIFLGAYFVCFNPKLQKRLKLMAARFAAPGWKLGYALGRSISGLLKPVAKV
jgi:hypothetical protein